MSRQFFRAFSLSARRFEGAAFWKKAQVAELWEESRPYYVPVINAGIALVRTVREYIIMFLLD